MPPADTARMIATILAIPCIKNSPASPRNIGIIDTIPIAVSAFLGLFLKAVFPVIISRYDAIRSGTFCIPIKIARAIAGPAAAMEAPIARDSGIESNPIPSSMPAPPPFFPQ